MKSIADDPSHSIRLSESRGTLQTMIAERYALETAVIYSVRGEPVEPQPPFIVGLRLFDKLTTQAERFLVANY